MIGVTIALAEDIPTLATPATVTPMVVASATVAELELTDILPVTLISALLLIQEVMRGLTLMSLKFIPTPAPTPPATATDLLMALMSATDRTSRLPTDNPGSLPIRTILLPLISPTRAVVEPPTWVSDWVPPTP